MAKKTVSVLKIKVAATFRVDLTDADTVTKATKALQSLKAEAAELGFVIDEGGSSSTFANAQVEA